MSAFNISAVVPGVAALAGASGPQRAASAGQAIGDFESLFIEMLLKHAGLAEALSTGSSPEGDVAGELFLRQLAQGLAQQLQLGFAQQLGITGLIKENSP